MQIWGKGSHEMDGLFFFCPITAEMGSENSVPD